MTQLRLDFGAANCTNTDKVFNVACQVCDLPIDLYKQRDRLIKSCPHCGDRTWLLNLTVKEASIMYGIDPKSLGERI